MAGPIRDHKKGAIECSLCGDPIPNREYCTILLKAYNDNGNPQKRLPSKEKVLCGSCGTMAMENPKTTDYEKDKMTLSEINALINDFIKEMDSNGEFAFGHKRNGLRQFRDKLQTHFREKEGDRE